MFGVERRTPPSPIQAVRQRALRWERAHALGKAWGPALIGSIGAVVVALVNAKSGKDDTDHRIGVTTRRAEVGYEKLAKPTNQQIDAFAAIEARLARLEHTVPAQGALLLANDFTVTGLPVRKKHRKKVDPVLIKTVKDNAAKDSKELDARVKNETPVVKPVPATLPAAPATSQSPENPPAT